MYMFTIQVMYGGSYSVNSISTMNVTVTLQGANYMYFFCFNVGIDFLSTETMNYERLLMVIFTGMGKREKNHALMNSLTRTWSFLIN